MLKITVRRVRARCPAGGGGAPQTVAAFKRLLPLESRSSTPAGAARPAGSRSATSTSGSAPRTPPAIRPPASSFYPGGVTETEILFPYGSVFATKAGALAGNHFATIVEGTKTPRRSGPPGPVGRRPEPIRFEET